jgi:membrane protein implicated in regulation of membrane protease activity
MPKLREEPVIVGNVAAAALAAVAVSVARSFDVALDVVEVTALVSAFTVVAAPFIRRYTRSRGRSLELPFGATDVYTPPDRELR